MCGETGLKRIGTGGFITQKAFTRREECLSSMTKRSKEKDKTGGKESILIVWGGLGRGHHQGEGKRACPLQDSSKRSPDRQMEKHD